MDNVRGFGDERIDSEDTPPPGGSDEPRMDIGTDERRMHVRAYNHWVSLLQGRAYPAIADLDPGSIVDFGPHSVLLDFSNGIENPAIVYLGTALRDECALGDSATHIADVPPRSLLSRLTDHYLQIIANRAPIGFEAEFVGTRGHNTLYRGILMPFSSDEDTIDYIYGVINWKELADSATQTQLEADIVAAVRTAAKATLTAPVWADGPSAGFADEEAPAPPPAAEPQPRPRNVLAGLADQLALAQASAAAVRAADTRTRAALYRALERAYDFAAAADADPVGYQALLDQAAIAVQLRAPMTPIVKLVFGADHDKTRLTEYAAVLCHARREGLEVGELVTFLEGFAGGIKGVVQAERAARTPAKPGRDPAATLSRRPTLARVALDVTATPGDYVVLLARAGADGLDIVAAMADRALTAQAMRKAAA